MAFKKKVEEPKVAEVKKEPDVIKDPNETLAYDEAAPKESKKK